MNGTAKHGPCRCRGGWGLPRSCCAATVLRSNFASFLSPASLLLELAVLSWWEGTWTPSRVSRGALHPAGAACPGQVRGGSQPLLPLPAAEHWPGACPAPPQSWCSLPLPLLFPVFPPGLWGSEAHL